MHYHCDNDSYIINFAHAEFTEHPLSITQLIGSQADMRSRAMFTYQYQLSDAIIGWRVNLMNYQLDSF